MKKIFALVLALAMVLSMVACGASEPAPTEAPKADTSVDTPADKPADKPAEEEKRVDVDEMDTSWIIDEDPTAVKGTVNFYIPFKGSQGMDDMIAEFNSIYPNIKINLNVFSNNTDGNASVNVAMDAGEVDVLASFGLRWLEKVLDGADNYELVSEDSLAMSAGTYSHPDKGSPFDERSKEFRHHKRGKNKGGK